MSLGSTSEPGGTARPTCTDPDTGTPAQPAASSAASTTVDTAPGGGLRTTPVRHARTPRPKRRARRRGPRRPGRAAAATQVTFSPTRHGRVMRKTAPSPTLPHACSHPPCSRTSSSAIDRPNPVPPVARARAGSARQNRPNTSEASPGRSPTPWSRTVTATPPSPPRRCTSTGPPSECSIALSTRLRSTRSIRRESASTMTGVCGRSTTILDPTPLDQRRGQIDHSGHQPAQVDRLDVEHGGAGVVPADLQQVGEQQLEPVELSLKQLGGPARAPAAGRRPSRAGGRPPSARS